MSASRPRSSPPSSLRPTVRTVAERAGVSTATVSRVVNGQVAADSPTGRRVRAVIAELGFRPSRLGRSLKTARSALVGIALPSLNDPLLSRVLQGAEAAAAAAGYGLLVTRLAAEEGAGAAAVERLLGHSVEGLLLAGAAPDPAALAGTPCVRLLDPGRAARRGMGCAGAGEGRGAGAGIGVGVEIAAALHELVALLQGCGHRRFAVLREAGLDDWLDAAVLRHAGLRPDLLVELPRGCGAPGEVLQLLRAGPQPPTALLCASDALALAVIAAARLRGLEVPRDLSVAGLQGVEPAAGRVPQLTAVVQPAEALGRAAFALLAARLTGGRGEAAAPGPERGDPLTACLRRGETHGPAPRNAAARG